MKIIIVNMWSANLGSDKAIPKDNENVAFVAGATGKVGSRAVRSDFFSTISHIIFL